VTNNGPFGWTASLVIGLFIGLTLAILFYVMFWGVA
jgi:hypothetical protein